MSFNLESIRKAQERENFRLALYAPPGFGKTCAIASFKNVLVAQTEVGTPHGVTFDAFQPKCLTDVMDCIGTLYAEKHDYKTFAIDTWSALDPMILAAVCAEHGKKSIEEFPYGRGYVEAQSKVRELLEGLNALYNDRGMNIVIAAHSRIRRFDDPSNPSFDRYEMDIHPKISPLIEREMDAILLIKDQPTVKQQDIGFNKERTYVEGSGRLFIYTESRPAFVAKNRWGLPAKIPYESPTSFYDQITANRAKSGK